MEKMEVIYEDQEILVCFKPAGVPTQTASLAVCDMVSLVKSYLAKKGVGKNPYLGLVHRLDQPVSGLLVFAKNKKAASLKISEKIYYALCLGIPVEKEGILRHDLWKNPETNMAQIKEQDDFRKIMAEKKGHNPSGKGFKEAVLSYKLKKEEDDCSLLYIKLETGRFHQIRAQFSFIGHPLLGDLKYGTKSSREISAKKQINTIALCACQLKLIHPVTREQMGFQVPQDLLPGWLSYEGKEIAKK